MHKSSSSDIQKRQNNGDNISVATLGRMIGMEALKGLLYLLVMFCVLILILNYIDTHHCVHAVKYHVTVHSRFVHLKYVCWWSHRPAEVSAEFPADRQYQPPDVWTEASPDDSRLHTSPSEGKLFLLCPAQIQDPLKSRERMKLLLLGSDCFATKVTIRTSVGSATSNVWVWLSHWNYTCTQGHHLQKSLLIWPQ